ncbi:MAG: gamma-glutamyltransferase [Thermoanaerobaculales bacterium]|nr:gamma-glutamyltransferase [Thermoanaerobaculales bacterium]
MMVLHSSRRRVGVSALTLVLLLAALVTTASAAHPEAARGTGGAVSSAAPAATAAGIEILRAGGNAADAAVATALALAVVHPQAGNLGGGGFAVVRFGDEVATLDFRETAPAGATPGMFLDRKGEPRPEASLVGPLAAGVPGSPAGLAELHARRGRLPWAQVVAPAVRLARDGFVVTRRLEAALTAEAALLAEFPETASVWLPGGRPAAAGGLMRLPELAATLEAYAAKGAPAITEGPLAAAVELASRRHGGVLRAADLTAYTPVWRLPVRFSAFGWEVASMPLPSAGGIVLGQTCGMLERLGWAAKPRFGADRAHLLAEAWRRAYADRFLLGDPRTSLAGAHQLLAPSWLERRAGEINPLRATPSDRVRSWSRAEVPESRETTHLSVLDGDGNAVALTTTLNGSFGCGLLVPGVGFLLNNEMDDFATAPGRPNLYGLVQGEANAVAPGKRMLSSMSPTVAWRGAEVVVLGSPGGSRIPTATVQVLLNLIVDGDELQAAVDRPRLHHQWQPDALLAEPEALAPETASALVSRGHEIRVVDQLGEVSAVRRSGGVVSAAQDPRGPGAAGVVRPDGD